MIVSDLIAMIYVNKQNKERRRKSIIELNLCFRDSNPPKSSWLKDLTGRFNVSKREPIGSQPPYNPSTQFKSVLLSPFPTSIYDETVVDPLHLGLAESHSKVNKTALKPRIRPLFKDSYCKVIGVVGSKYGLVRTTQSV